MARRRRQALPLALFLWLFLLLLPAGSATGAQEDGPRVRITWPNEGETLYAGPTSLLYKAPVKGRVERAGNVAAVDVRLDVFRGQERIGYSLHTTPAADGTFAFELTVNPQGSTEQFEIGFYDCGTACHSEGQMALQPGHLRLEVTATDSQGRQRTATRQITVDVSGEATVPVQVLVEGEPVAGVTVSAATRLYLWRARHGSGVTGADGQAQVEVEALGQAPTTYVFQVDRTLVDGVLYEGLETAEVVLPPGAENAPAITLTATGRRGAIAGRLEGEERVAVHAVRLSDGGCFEAQPTAAGAFAFHDMPIDRYLLTAGSAAPTTVDLVAKPEAQLTLPAAAPPPVTVVVADPEGARLPFAWATIAGKNGMAQPRNGTVRLASAPEGASLTVHAPGYYSQAQIMGELPFPVTLTPHPKTRLLPWGAGRIVLPAASRVQVEGQTITLEQGWLWGEGGGVPLAIRTPAATLAIAEGAFALELLPGERAWLYLFAGEARVWRHEGPPVAVAGGQMVNLWREEQLRPVVYDPVAVSVLAPDNPPAWLAPAWEPALRAQMRDRLARAGIGTAQAVTFATYTLFVLLLFTSPLLVLYLWRRARQPGGEGTAPPE